MLVDESERHILWNYSIPSSGFFSFIFEARGVARILDIQAGKVQEIPLTDERIGSDDDVPGGVAIPVVSLRGQSVEIAARAMFSPARWISKITVSDAGVSFEGDLEIWKRLPRAYHATFSFRGSSHEHLLLLDSAHESVDVQRLDWYNEETYDMGYQAVLGVAEIPDSNLLVFPVQRDSKPVVYDPTQRKVVGAISLADRGGNPEILFRRKVREAWADDYDTMLRLDPSDWRIVNHLRLQSGTKKLDRQFIGEFSFDREESLCAVGRPFSHDVLALDTKTFEVTHRAELSHQPLFVALLSDRRIFARDWKTGRVLHGELRPIADSSLPPGVERGR